MNNSKWSEIKYVILKVFIVLLFLSNVFFYTKYRELNNNSKYVSRIPSRIYLAAYEDLKGRLRNRGIIKIKKVIR